MIDQIWIEKITAYNNMADFHNQFNVPLFDGTGAAAAAMQAFLQMQYHGQVRLEPNTCLAVRAQPSSESMDANNFVTPQKTQNGAVWNAVLQGLPSNGVLQMP